MKKIFAGLFLLGMFLSAASPAFAHHDNQRKPNHFQPSIKYYAPDCHHIPVRYYKTISYYPQSRNYSSARYYDNRYDKNAVNIRIKLF